MPNYQSNSVSVILDKRVMKKDGTYPLKLWVYYNSTNKKYGLKISVTEEDWKKLNGQKVKQENLQKLKKKIDIEVGRATKIIKELGEEFTIDLFDSLYLNNPLKCPKTLEKDIICQLYIQYIQKMRGENRIGNAEAYETAFKSIKKFSPSLPLKKLTPQFLQEYENWMLENGKSITTVGIYLRTLRTIVNIVRDKRMITEDTYPFGMRSKNKYEIPIGKNIKKALSVEELHRIIHTKMPTEEAEFARDLWLFSLYCNGMNMVDIFSLKYTNIQDDFIYFSRIKTSRTKKNQIPIAVYITDSVSNIIKRWGQKDKSPDNYIFNIYNSLMSPEEKYQIRHNHTRLINGYMKRLAKKIGINSKLTTYVARHSWATLLKNQGVSIAEISEGLGHSSLEITQNYLDSFPQEHKKQTAINFQNIFVTNKD